MSVYYGKKSLYNEVASIKRHLGYNETEYGMSLIDLCKDIGVIIDEIPFKTKGLRGMAILGDSSNEDIILLNQNRNLFEKNYDCGHEIIHLCLHRKVGLQAFNCFDNVGTNQNPFYEWHANEGSAEFLVPYKVLLPLIKENSKFINSYYEIESFKNYLADIFRVPTAVIKYRFENLKYEIHQYLSGISVDDLDILSMQQQSKRNINIRSINDVADYYFNIEINKTFYG